MPARPLRLLLFTLACIAATLVYVAPAAAQLPPQPTGAPQFKPYWVAVQTRTTLRAGADPASPVFGEIPSEALLQAVESNGTRLRVWNPLNNGFAWVDATAVAQTTDPSPDELAQLTSFQPWWGMTHRIATIWSSEAADATSWGRIPQWRYLRVLSPVYGGRVLTLDPRSNVQSYVDVANLGPVDEPPEAYFENATPDEKVVDLPGRIIRDTDWFEQPASADYFAQDRLQINTAVQVAGSVEAEDGSSWYRIGDDQFVPAATVRLPQAPDRTFPGRWIDANISEPVIVTAYEDDRPIYSALAVKGSVAFQTPLGVFRILRRVMNETMDSLTIGIPREAKDGYYLKDVLFTQYFSGDGAALHYNYWRSDWGYAGSHGCLGMNYDDSLFFWEFGSVGTPVYVHE